MKWLTTTIMIVLLPIGLAADIVNNSGSTSADSLTIPFVALDSVGNITSLATGDSITLAVFYPSGGLANSVALAENDSRIISSTSLGYTTYALTSAVANIDGAGRDGLYAYTIVVKDKTGAALATPTWGSFQLYQGADLHSRLSEIRASLDSLESHDNWVARLDNQISLSSDNTTLLARTAAIEDTANAIIDSFQSGLQLSAAVQENIVDATWDELGSAHTVPGSFGSFLDAQISGVGSGGGAYSVGLIAFDSINGLVVPGAAIAVRNLDQTALIASGRTATDGEAQFNLDAASYTAVATAPGYLFEPFDSFTVGGTGADTIYGVSFDPGTPASPALCRAWGYLYDISGSALGGETITASLPSGVKRQGSIVISPFLVTTTSDSTGYFYLDLIPSDSLAPSGAKYEFTVVSAAGTVLRQRLEVPAGTSWQITW